MLSKGQYAASGFDYQKGCLSRFVGFLKVVCRDYGGS